ncbi:Kinesin-like protein KIF20B [Frankliniella fusca]|uniref:Kinesin-like protein KIF20B n=1 Tax=Frankliniella fusca TaxID=407009 RepID=A0AAE1LI08_9NEOP|nr:Kinesin-like protein KIF20B [Frankliniella fusca]
MYSVYSERSPAHAKANKVCSPMNSGCIPKYSGFKTRTPTVLQPN